MPWEFLFHPGRGGERKPGERGSIQKTPRMVPGQLSDCILDEEVESKRRLLQKFSPSGVYYLRKVFFPGVV
jgi:hypothetical protein